MAKEKLFVLSLDAVVHEDVAYLMQKPNFSRIMEHRAEVEKVCSVFPSVTYPAHTTLMTGCTPGVHGIYNNVPFRDYNDGKKHWYLYHKYVRVEDLFAAAKRAGLTTASVYWPITGCNPNVDYIINEYFFFYPEEDTLEAFRKMGANEEALQAVRENWESIAAKRRKEEGATSDQFLMGCAASLIRNVQPDVMLVHNCAADSARHVNGVFHPNVKLALDRIDLQLGQIIEAMEDAGVWENTNFVIVSDHGQLNLERRTRINVLLQREGFQDLAPDGTLYDWRAYAQTNGMSASIYLRDPADQKLYQEVYAFLNRLVEEKKWGLSRVYTTEEAKEKYGTYGPFSFMIASDGVTGISEVYSEEIIEELGADEQRPRRATHGHEPELGPQPVFLAHGPAFRHGAVLPHAELIDIAPTLAASFGETLPQAQGRVLKELLREQR